MGKLWCRCGYLLSNSSDNNNVNLNVFTELGFQSVIAEDFQESLEHRITLWWCPVCERMYHHDLKSGRLRVWALESEAESYPQLEEDATEELETRYFDYDQK